MSDNELEVYKQFQTSQDKYIYFILAISASAIAYTIQKVENRIFEWSLIPLGLAIVSWGLSFYYGCLHIMHRTSNLYLNLEMYKTADGRSEDIPKDPQYKNVKMDVLKTSFETNSEKSSRFASRQFKLIIIGGILFVLWNILEMYLRTIKR